MKPTESTKPANVLLKEADDYARSRQPSRYAFTDTSDYHDFYNDKIDYIMNHFYPDYKLDD